MFTSLSEVKELKGRRVLLRSSLNVPIQGGEITDDMRIRKALPTVELLRERGAKTIIIGHLSEGPDASLQPVFEYLQKKFPLRFVEDLVSSEAEEIFRIMQEGDVVLAENIRRYPEEEKNDEAFARRLAALADLFIEDDFTALHRAHASVVSLPKFLPSAIGLQCADEVKHLSQAFDPPRPSLLVMGGAKPETKIPFLARMSARMDTVCVGGISANVILRAKGIEVGRSITSQRHIEIDGIRENETIVLPLDALVETPDGARMVKKITELSKSDTIRDAGPGTVEMIRQKISGSAFVLWNGPLGDYEKGFYDATIAVGRSLAESDAYSIVGGGDTIAALDAENLLPRFTFVSTAGAAMIEFLSEGTLPGLEALAVSTRPS